MAWKIYSNHLNSIVDSEQNPARRGEAADSINNTIKRTNDDGFCYQSTIIIFLRNKRTINNRPFVLAKHSCFKVD